ncbi:MAG: CAP domain-containing protein [Bacteroidota bacterium]
MNATVLKSCSFLLLSLTLFCSTSCTDDPEILPSPALAENLLQPDRMLEAVNTWRVNGCTCGNEQMPPVEPVSWNEELEGAALRHSKDMAEKNYFSHTGSDGSTHSQRIADTGYAAINSGENIAAGTNFTDEEQLVQLWIDSPGHCKNIMNASFKEMGVAQVKNESSDYIHYWTQIFGSSN